MVIVLGIWPVIVLGIWPVIVLGIWPVIVLGIWPVIVTAGAENIPVIRFTREFFLPPPGCHYPHLTPLPRPPPVTPCFLWPQLPPLPIAPRQCTLLQSRISENSPTPGWSMHSEISQPTCRYRPVASWPCYYSTVRSIQRTTLFNLLKS